jgi:hypothetical protein
MKVVLHMLKILKTEHVDLNKVVMYVDCMQAYHAINDLAAAMKKEEEQCDSS